MRHLTNSLGHDEDGDHHNALLDHIQSEIAHATVQSLAGRDEGAARDALSSGRLADLIPDDQKASLDTYIGNMANLRATDNQARQAEIARQHIQGSNQTAAQWLGGLTDPQTGSLWFPDNWGQRMLADNRLSPPDRAGLHSAYQNLNNNGDPHTSDPNVVADLLQRATLPPQDPDHPPVAEVVSHVGNRLSLADAGYIANRLGPQNQATNSDTHALVSAMQDAREKIGNPVANARFVSWLLPAARSGNLDLDPQSKDYSLSPERMQRFLPTGDDIIQPAVKPQTGMTRLALADIFGGRG